MATSAGGKIAAPQIFTSDPIEQGLTGKVFAGDPGTSGFAGAMLLAEGMRRERNQGTYLDELRASNRLAALLEQQSNQTELTKTALQQGHNYTAQGFLPADMPLVGQFFQDPNAPTVMEPPKSFLEERRAKIAKLMAEAAKDRAGGAGKEPQYELEYTHDAAGNTVAIQGKVKGGLSQRDAIDRAAQAGSSNARNQRGNPNIPQNAPPYYQRGVGENQSGAREVWMRNHPGQTFPGDAPGGRGSRSQ